jgi:predicted solute-binding protein
MLHGPQRGLFDVQFCLPSECALRMAGGSADIGILPSIELERQDLAMIPGTGIACRGAVRSILLVTKVPPGKIRTLAADSSSRTSVELARVVLERRYGAAPRVEAFPPDLAPMLETHDAALVIGDPALRLGARHPPFAVLDLGEEWVAMTGLPMVFAVWGCRDPGVAAELAPAFAASCRFGRERLEEIARREGPPRQIGEALAFEYLSRHIVNELGENEYQGMGLFLRYARELEA